MLAIALFKSQLGTNAGMLLLNGIHVSGLLALVLLAPLLTADVISRERREGTLDLLFLTPLTATKLVFAKFTTQLLRILSIWAVLIPLSVVPFLSGGVAPRDVYRMLLLDLTAIFLALTAGMLASALNKRALAATLSSIGLAALFLWLDWKLINIPGLTRPGTARWAMETILAGNLAIVLVASIFLLLQIARILVKAREREENSARRVWFRQVFLTPKFWRRTFNRSMRRRMDRNPLIWLEYRTAWSRVGRTAMIAALIFCESVLLMFDDGIRNLSEFHQIIGFSLLTILAITSASSFQREKENGAFELLLVAPFTEFSLLSGRLRAVWSYYAPVAFTLFSLMIVSLAIGIDWTGIFSYHFSSDRHWVARAISRFWSGIASFITIPIAGLFFALRLKHFITTLIATLAAGLFLPMYFWSFVDGLRFAASYFFPNSILPNLLSLPFEGGSFPWTGATLALHFALAAFFLVSTHRRLKARQFN